MQRMWYLVYLGSPDHITFDKGTGYVSKEMKHNISASVVTLREAPIENLCTIGTVERNDSPLISAYDKIIMEIYRETSNHECLTMTFFP